MGRRLYTLVAIVAIAATADMAAFAGRVVSQSPPAPETRADGVAALTGGSRARLTEAMTLLEAGRAQRLLVSGVHPSVSEADLASLLDADAELLACCVDIDRRARSTYENGREVADWAAQHGYGTVFLVTDDYHMARSLLEVRAALPDVDVIAYPVRDPARPSSDWLRDPDMLRRMATEWIKWRIVWLRRTLGGETRTEPSPPAASET